MTKEDMETVAQVVVQTIKEMGLKREEKIQEKIIREDPGAVIDTQENPSYEELEARIAALEGKNALENRLENGFGESGASSGQVFEGKDAYNKMIDALTGQLNTAQELNRKFFSVLQNPAQTQPKTAEEILADAVR